MSNVPYNLLEGERPDLSFKLNPDHSEEKITIIVVHKDCPEYLNICLQTLTVASSNNNYEIIVVDNASGRRSQDFLDQLEKDGVKVVRNQENLWWSKAANLGVKAASKNSKYFVFLHHDICILNPSWLDVLIQASVSRKSGLVGVKLRKYEMGDHIAQFVDESCMLVTRECWNDAGPFNEEFPLEGPGFLFTILANKTGHNPIAIDQKAMYVHHFKIFAVDYNEYTRMNEKAKIELPKHLTRIQEKFGN